MKLPLHTGAPWGPGPSTLGFISTLRLLTSPQPRAVMPVSLHIPSLRGMSFPSSSGSQHFVPLRRRGKGPTVCLETAVSSLLALFCEAGYCPQPLLRG